ncbi:BMP family protein [Thermanaerothrix sp.]|uniref:BMP family protein n=1 Tax=Thermanaerothrix sp. TaxID=2972675 RepID=UPI002ADDCEE5|nr:BMP family protein [Thermanaerothrix sp.]
MKSVLSRLLMLVVLVALFLSACAPAATPAPTQAPEKPIRIAIVMPSSITDMAFSQGMYEALLKVQQELGGPSKMEIAYSENLYKVPDAAAAIRDYASQGYDIVIAHGSQYGTSVAQIAPEFPNTTFAWGTATDTFADQGIKNVFAYNPAAEQGGYVLGTIAALMSKSGVLGVCGPVEAGDAKTYVDGFKYGAEQARPDVKVQVTYTGSFSDVSLMAAAAETHIAAGADMLTGSSQSVVGAIGVAKEKGAKWFGQQWDQTSLAPDIVVANQVYDYTGIIKDMIAKRKAGTLGGVAYTLTLANGGLTIKYNDRVPVPADVKAKADEVIKGIIDGTIKPLPY